MAASSALVAYEAVCSDGPPFHVGVLQPSATSIDGHGRLAMFARVECGSPADSHPVRWALDLSGFDDGHPPALSAPERLPFDGLNDASFVYDVARDLFYIVRSQHPLPVDSPNNITSQVQVAAMSGAGMASGTGRWQPLGNLAPADDGGNSFVTGFPRNHNAGLARTPLGRLYEPDTLEVAYTVSALGPTPDWLWSNRIWTVAATIQR